MTEYRVFPATNGPNTSSAFGNINLGMEFYVTASGVTATKLHFYRGTTSIVDTVTGYLWRVDSSSAGTLLATKAFPTLSGVGWQTAVLDTPIALTANQRYRVAYWTSNHFTQTDNMWVTGGGGLGAADIVNGILVAPTAANSTGGGQMSYQTGSAGQFPATSDVNSNGYWADVTVDWTPPPQDEGSMNQPVNMFDMARGR